MKTVVIYHRSDFDGVFCREIAKKFLPDAEFIGWDYGDPVPAVKSMKDEEVQIYMLDISVEGLMGVENLIWIDHHKSAIEKYPKEISGYRIDGVAACRLAWQWFSRRKKLFHPTAGLKPEHDACFGFAWRDGQWTVSLYHAPGKEHHDLSLIAVKHGGGGHRGACGFRVKTLPFLT